MIVAYAVFRKKNLGGWFMSCLGYEIEQRDIFKMRKAPQKHSSLPGVTHVYLLNDEYQYWEVEREEIKDDFRDLISQPSQ
ncbi:MAG: hypothetical protein R6U19_00990 [Bacteroidales bacterium]